MGALFLLAGFFAITGVFYPAFMAFVWLFCYRTQSFKDFWAQV